MEHRVIFHEKDKKASELTLGELEDFIYAVVQFAVQQNCTQTNLYHYPTAPQPWRPGEVICNTIDKDIKM